MELTKKEFELALQVERNFYEYIYISTLIGLKERSLQFNEKHKKFVNRKRVAGLVSEADVMEFEVRDSLLQSEYVSQKLELEETRIKLKNILGPEVGEKIRPVGKLQNQTIDGTLMSYVDQLKEKNHQILLTTHSVGRAKVNNSIAQAAWLPEVDFQAQFGMLPLDERIDRTADATTARFLLTANFRLFSGFRDYYSSRRDSSRVAEAEHMLKDEIVQSVSAVEALYRKLKAIETRINLEKNNILRTEKYYDAVVSEYRRGSKNSADLAMAIDQYFAALQKREGLKFDFLNNKINFEMLMGQPIRVNAAKQI